MKNSKAAVCRLAFKSADFVVTVREAGVPQPSIFVYTPQCFNNYSIFHLVMSFAITPFYHIQAVQHCEESGDKFE